MFITHYSYKLRNQIDTLFNTADSRETMQRASAILRAIDGYLEMYQSIRAHSQATLIYKSG
jgi:hypothetical protein